MLPCKACWLSLSPTSSQSQVCMAPIVPPRANVHEIASSSTSLLQACSPTSPWLPYDYTPLVWLCTAPSHPHFLSPMVLTPHLVPVQSLATAAARARPFLRTDHRRGHAPTCPAITSSPCTWTTSCVACKVSMQSGPIVTFISNVLIHQQTSSNLLQLVYMPRLSSYTTIPI